MGCNQVGTSHHNGVEGQGQSQNRVAREICQLECLCNGDICGEPLSTPQEENNYHKEAWVWEGGTWPCPCPYSRVFLGTVCCHKSSV